jgi:hypothetical protein
MIVGGFSLQDKLHFEVSLSMAAVPAQKEDKPDDPVGPTFTFGYVLSDRFNSMPAVDQRLLI